MRTNARSQLGTIEDDREVLVVEGCSATTPRFCNRVQSTGEIIAVSARGNFMGNRGRIHNGGGSLSGEPWSRRAWICCVLSPKSPSSRTVMGDGYTHLFFLDEAVALAAGHRPCVQCRRADYYRYRAAWCAAFGYQPMAPQIDARMHADRVDANTKKQKRHLAELAVLPDASFIFIPGTDQPALILGDHLYPCLPEGYEKPLRRPAGGMATVLTPRCTIALLAAGYCPALHPSIDAGRLS